MIEEAVELFSGAARLKKINLAHLLSPSTPRSVIGDEGRVRQVLTNVLGNAVKFTAAGEVVLYVDAADIGGDRIRLDFRVRDTGIGIPPEKQRDIFDIFAQVDGSTTRRYGGTGLGLSIARQLCEMMGGSISVESELGAGSTFRFSIVVGAATDDVWSESAEEWPALRGKTALVVDDNETNLEIIESHLSRMGIRTRSLTDPVVALGILQEAAGNGISFDFVLIDKNLPSMDGSELARRIRADATLSSIHIVILSSSDDISDTAGGGERWLLKPVRKSELYECLALTSPRPPAAAPRPEEPPFEVTTPATGPRVLLAEDNEVNLELSRILLQLEGCSVAVATDGRQALAASDQELFDLIFMDCQMPEMDGFEATAAIRDREAALQRHTPIIAVTANAIEGDRERCLRAGMDDYLPKPISRNSIRTMLGRWGRDSKSSPRLQVRPAEPVTTDKENALSDSALRMLHDLESDADRGVVHRLMSRFLDSSPGLLEDLRQGAAERDGEKIRVASHTLKSASAIIGAVTLATSCARLEALVRQGYSEEARALVEDIIRQYQSIRPSVEAQSAGAAEVTAAN
jgi:CheY-like chemotaxis protein/HPt (histidine-containing phosphotransfer) domain-containing protein